LEESVTLPLRWSLFLRLPLLQAGFGDERRQGLGFAWAIDPALSRAYSGDAAGLAAARARHLAPFNAQPCAAGLPLGVAAALEARAAGGDAGAAARAVALKAALGSALSGSADAFFWGALRPLSAATAVFIAAEAARSQARAPLAWGAGAGLFLFNAPALWARWAGVKSGLSEGEGAAAAAARLPAQVWIQYTRRAAAVMIVAGVWAAVSSRFGIPRDFAAVSFAAGAGLGRFSGGPLRLVAGAALLGAAASAAGMSFAGVP
jgi:mannose/fructose/N-acetylgalactosamine-specific phosphotransferase system component IID